MIYVLKDTVDTRRLGEDVDGGPRLASGVGVDLGSEGASTVGVNLEYTHSERAVGGDRRDTAEGLRDRGH